MTAVTLACPLCAGIIQIDESLAGQQVACPLCHGALMLPPADVLAQFAQAPAQFQPSYQPPPDQRLSLSCPACNNSLQVTAEMSGQQVACPYCSTPIVVPPLHAPPQWETPVEAVVENTPQPTANPTSAYEDFDLSSLLPPGADPPPSNVPQPAPSKVSSPAKSPASKSREPAAADRLPPTRSQPHPRENANEPAAASIPASVDRFPPGHSSRTANPLANDRFPPGQSGATPREPVQRDDRLPPPRKEPDKLAKTEKIDERLPPRQREPGPPPAVKSEPPVMPEPAPTVDDLLPPGALPPSSPVVPEYSQLPPARQEPEPAPSRIPPKGDRELPNSNPAGTPPSQVAIAPVARADVDALLPPGMLPLGSDVVSSSRPIPASLPTPAPSPIDHLLPPGAAEVNTATAGRPTSPQPASIADVLLPPGAAAGPIAGGVPGTEVPLPKMQAGPLRPVLAPGQTPATQGLNVEASKKEENEPTAGIRKLSPEEKASRRLRRNAILFTVCLAILFAVFYFMAR